ncbi:NAD(P)/FAD-dependent oxidoreductase [Marinobacter nanhaiticus D15-8W]|uniref:NAD(P)/FAD-dependent oxidoreductase n=1 Tax=Marinobacter nanhaiticus D15-8W TaxID=626887 RepID=N6X3H2_9GAMM|nr:NAD(P)/FAD-dependent oxidoreductase [Marinobacter nanhaiticus]ENO15613.2 NAD(P)/FAD-dependent oxidoreductase [Marinobacter nanhaiticus D15-8W]
MMSKATAQTKNSKAPAGATQRRRTRPHTVLIVGAGFAGLGAALRLQQEGIRDVVILERAADIGGTWRDNTYPGAACDIPSNLYSFSFAPNPDWSRSFAGSREILRYIHHLADSHKLRQKVRFNQDVSELVYHEKAGVWTATTQSGESYQAHSAIMAQGPLSKCSFPDIPGIDSFKGHKVHSARWDHDYDFRGKRVAVIGTGASGVQIVPELVGRVDRLKVFQRTPGWVLPRPDFATPEWNKLLFRKLPGAQSAMRRALYVTHESMALGIIWNSPLTGVMERVAKAHLNHQVKDAWMRRQLKPDFRIGCKRVLMSSDYYPALQRDNCELITWPIARISEEGIRTAEGIEHQFDCIVFATGFDVSHSGTPFRVVGRKGRELAEDWRCGAHAYKSINVSGYPNLFMTFGPNSGPGHNSALVYMESQIEYLVRAIRLIEGQNLKSLEVRKDVQKRHNRAIQKRLARTNWNSGCKSWYLTEDGFNATMFPGFATQYARQMKGLNLKDYRIERGSGRPQ